MIPVVRALVPGSGPEIPVLSVRSGRPGPSAVITANLHGDECVGVAAVHMLAERLVEHLTRGVVHLYPSLNPEGLLRRSRTLPVIEADLNRCFPGRAGGDRAARHAWRLWRNILSRQPTLVVDLHSDSGAAIPYAIVDRVVRGAGRKRLEARCRTLAAASGLTVLSEYPGDQYLRYRLDCSLPGALVNNQGIAAVTLEVGPPGFVSRDAAEVAAVGAMGILTEFGMMSCPAPEHPSCRHGDAWRRASGPVVSAEGIFVPQVRPGQWAAAGSLLGTIRALDGTVRQRLLLQQPGFVVSLVERAWIRPGQACATLGVSDRR